MNTVTEQLPESAMLVSALPALQNTAAIEETAAIEALLTTLRSEVQGKNQRTRAVIIGVIALLVSIVAGSVLLPNAHWLVCFAGLGVVATVWADVTTKHKETLKQLSVYDDPRVVGPLLDSFDIRENPHNNAVRERLILSLPTLRADHAGLLTSHQRERLNKLLLGRDGRLILAALAALEQVGDSSCIPAVRRLANGEQSARANGEIRAAAARCLQYVEQHADLAVAQSQLLRASSAAATPAPGLLIAASGVSPDASAVELLRPANDNGAVAAK